VQFGDVVFRFEQPRSPAIGSRTEVRGVEHTLLVSAEAEAPPPNTEPLSVRPRRRSGWAIKQVGWSGAPAWVLRNTRTGEYLQLDERQFYVWEQLDGENTVRDILFAYAQRFGELGLPVIESTLHTLAAAGLVRGLHGQRDPRRRSWPRRLGHALLTALMRLEIAIGGIDRLVARLYERIGWRFFTRVGVVLLWVTVIGGLYGFREAQAKRTLFDVGGAGVAGVVAVALAYMLALVVHESAHALAVASYGRQVRRGGFMLMMGMPFAFVDTSDMWLGTRWSRIVVALSGPLTTAAMAGGAALGAAYLPGDVAPAILYQVSFGLYLNTLYNFNPLVPLDGYYALADALRMPRLREEAGAYFRRGLWSDLRARRRPGLREIGLAVYGLAALVGSFGFLYMGIFAWRARLGGLVRAHVHAPFDTVVVVAGIGLVMFPVWLGFATKLIAAVRRQRERRRRALEPAAIGATA
jgi:putative peptide zinc metalloprotease protein